VLIQCSGAVLLLGTADHRHDSGLQAEMVKQGNDLAVLMREVSRKNRELAETNEIIDRLARTDALTGLANRRTLFEALRREIVRTERLGEGFSLIIIDLDQFKSINDEYGHLIGDQVLVSAAAVFASQLRPYDLAARYGGEEFVLLLPGTSQDQAAVVAERVRNAISKLEVGEYPRGITVSLGAACWMTGETAEETIARADKALYRAKQSGRNRVEVAASVRK
jgi:chemotaxis family two-component system sensor kinase Cph1